ncbi:hypothetical protein IOD13_18485 [Brevibacterium casei]|nr:hypothetical protein [Brevibacterium casei]
MRRRTLRRRTSPSSPVSRRSSALRSRPLGSRPRSRESTPRPKSHDKAHLQAERGYMPQHGKKSQPRPRWNLPRRQG